MHENRLRVLDGWRAISILLVLLCHLFPLGPRSWMLGKAVGDYGMTIFFVLSGFLIVLGLNKGQSVLTFLIKRLFRIVPLAWLYISVVIIFFQLDDLAKLAHFLFYANYHEQYFIPRVTNHFWSLCIEVHFYIGVALLFVFYRKSAVYILPVLCILFTCLRYVEHGWVSVVTHLRIDEILAGSVLAIVYGEGKYASIAKLLEHVSILFVAILLFPACHIFAGKFCLLRPYLCATLVGATLYQQTSAFSQFLTNKIFSRIAAVSYSVYILHPLLAQTWLGTGDLLVKYLKRPLLLLVVFVSAHISTYYYERYAIRLGKSLALRFRPA